MVKKKIKASAKPEVTSKPNQSKIGIYVIIALVVIAAIVAVIMLGSNKTGQAISRQRILTVNSNPSGATVTLYGYNYNKCTFGTTPVSRIISSAYGCNFDPTSAEVTKLHYSTATMTLNGNSDIKWSPVLTDQRTAVLAITIGDTAKVYRSISGGQYELVGTVTPTSSLTVMVEPGLNYGPSLEFVSSSRTYYGPQFRTSSGKTTSLFGDITKSPPAWSVVGPS